MSATNLQHYLDDDYEYEPEGGRRTQPKPLKSGLHNRPTQQRSDHELVDEMMRYGDVDDSVLNAIFSPSFSASRHERGWILYYLGPFYDKKVILDVVRKVKGGKEANVYCCRAHPDTGLELLAAKVYRPRAFRNLRNDARYRQGRQILDDEGKVVRDDRLLRAIAKGTRAGKEAQHTSWLEHEYQTMLRLHAAGTDVPRPVTSGSNTVLMEYLGDEARSAPALNEVHLPRNAARPLFDRLLWNIELMLANGRVHGDLSAYNVLYWQGRAAIIDFPQAIDPAVNADARDIFGRDVQRICDYFARYGVRSDPPRLAAAIWERVSPEAVELVPEEVAGEEVES